MAPVADDRDLWIALRRALLLAVQAIEAKYDLQSARREDVHPRK